MGGGCIYPVRLSWLTSFQRGECFGSICRIEQGLVVSHDIEAYFEEGRAVSDNKCICEGVCPDVELYICSCYGLFDLRRCALESERELTVFLND